MAVSRLRWDLLLVCRYSESRGRMGLLLLSHHRRLPPPLRAQKRRVLQRIKAKGGFLHRLPQPRPLALQLLQLPQQRCNHGLTSTRDRALPPRAERLEPLDLGLDHADLLLEPPPGR